jgi:hypothetical protein
MAHSHTSETGKERTCSAQASLHASTCDELAGGTRVLSS